MPYDLVLKGGDVIDPGWPFHQKADVAITKGKIAAVTADIPASEAIRAKLNKLKDVTTRLLKNNPTYKCKSCGFSSRVLYWQCPSCRHWNTVKPLQESESKR